MEKITEGQAKTEILNLINDYNEKTDKIIAEAKANGTWRNVLDGNKRLFVDVDKWYNQKIEEIKQRCKNG